MNKRPERISSGRLLYRMSSIVEIISGREPVKVKVNESQIKRNAVKMRVNKVPTPFNLFYHYFTS